MFDYIRTVNQVNNSSWIEGRGLIERQHLRMVRR